MTDIIKKRSIIRVGSRKSELALIQTNHVISCLQKFYPEEKFEIHTMTTMGDRVLNISLPKIGEKALFTKDLEDALTNGRVDFVVHSLKDLPTCLPDGMAIGAILEREDPRDALVLNAKYSDKTLATLPEGSIIGTSSLRRAAQLARSYSHLKVQDIRGNLNTRLAKLDAENSIFAGIVLAKAGLIRMGWQKRINQTLDEDDILYAVGQGALAVECRANDIEILKMLRKLHCVQTQCKILTERSFLKTLGGGCSAPVAVKTQITPIQSTKNLQINITGSVWSLDGKIQIQGSSECCVEILDNEHNDDDDDAIPTKRRKIDDNIDPPKVINDNIDTSTEKLDVNAFINIHGDLFKKCPHLVKQHKSSSGDGNDNETVLETTKVDAKKCPIHSLAVGQDVMGECPYFATSEKILAATTSAAAENIINNNDITNQLANKIDGAGDYDGQSSGKCPFLSISTNDEKSKCPIVSKVEEKSKVENETCVPSSSITITNETLYCGLYRHKCIPLNIYEKCELLGKNLATNLIENGALHVMEAAQLEIRKKI